MTVKEVTSLSVSDLAKREIEEERTREAVEKLKVLYTNLNSSKQVTKNIEREIADLEAEIKQEIEDINS